MTESEARSVRAAIVSVGNELLFGETVDTNAAWLGRKLTERGIPVVRRFTVGDVAADIRSGLVAAMDVADLVLVTGGLGPTPDDLTKGVVAEQLGRPLVIDPFAETALREYYASAGRSTVPHANRGQAEVPEGATVLRNPVGTAPGLLIEEGGARVVLFPGVPRELKAIFEGALQPVLDEMAGGQDASAVRHRVVHTTGIPESSLAERVEAGLAQLPDASIQGIALAYLPDILGVDLRFTVTTRSDDEANDRFDALFAELDDVLRPWRFEAESGDLAEAVVDALRDRGLTLATAESCTGGLVAKRITDRAGASRIFMGGIVAYANAVKVSQLGVFPADIEREGAVSEPVARQLAAGAASRLGAHAGIGITGVAGPGGGSEEKPVGSVWIGTALHGSAEAHLFHFPGDREAVRERAAQEALALLYRRLTGLAED